MGNGIGLLVQDVVIGKKVFYYSFVGEDYNSEPQPAVITSGPCELCGTLCCGINIQNSIVSLSNLSEVEYPEKKSPLDGLSAKKRKAKDRYQLWLHSDSDWTFGEFVKYRIYENYE